ncbi:MAG: fimbrial protein [Betaproteobacteria bacterium]|nr:fimbrial protein [Betaproteobacteria bacterium]
MILINLLPHRELERERRRHSFNQSLCLAASLGGLVAALVFVAFQAQISAQHEKNQLLQTEINRFDAQIKDIASLQAEITALRARQHAVEDLQADRNLPVFLLNELVRLLPEGVFIASLRQDGQALTLLGAAQSNERVSELLRNLGNQSPWFARPELVEIVAGTQALSPRDQRRVSNFTIRVRLVRASDTDKPKVPGVPALMVSAPQPTQP